MSAFFVFFRRLFFALLVLFVVLTMLSRGERFADYQKDSWFLRPFIMAAAPFQKAYTYTVEGVSNSVRHYLYLVGLWEENQALLKAKQDLEGAMLLFKELQSENQRLSELVNITKRRQWKTIAARVIAHEPQSMSRLITIDRGEKDGIERRQPVVSKDGLVGQVHRVGSHVSQVLLITDPSSTVDVISERSRARGIVSGILSQLNLERHVPFMSQLEYVEHAADIQDGDRMVTSSLDGIYPKGVLIGQVVELKSSNEEIFQRSKIVPAVDMNKLEEIIVIKQF